MFRLFLECRGVAIWYCNNVVESILFADPVQLSILQLVLSGYKQVGETFWSQEQNRFCQGGQRG
jgi:hypothetical protein